MDQPAQVTLSNNVTSNRAPAASPGKVVRLLHATADAVERWMIDSGALDQLGFLVTRTTLVRQGVFAAATWILGAGFTQGNTAEMIIGAAVAVAVGTVNAFIARIRAKYNGQAQAILGTKQDHFIGPETVSELASLATRAALATDTLKSAAPNPQPPASKA